MSPIMKILAIGVLILTITILQGCGSSTPNSEAVFKATSKAHVENWLPAGHMTAARADEAVCTECHGGDFSGGVSGVSCSKCHLGGKDSVHPADWGAATYYKHAQSVAANTNRSCANASCHGGDLAGVTGSGPSCSSCHLGGPGSVHPLDWAGNEKYTHGAYVVAQQSTASCRNVNCHGANLEGVANSGISCYVCH